MALTDTFVRQVKPTGKANGDKYADGAGMYLLVKTAGKYWRMDYTFAGKRKTLALGTYPEVSLAKARDRRAAARELLADGTDPSAAKREEKRARPTRRRIRSRRLRESGWERLRPNEQVERSARSRHGSRRTCSPSSARCPSPPSVHATFWSGWSESWKHAALSIRPIASSSFAGRCSASQWCQDWQSGTSPPI